MVFTELKLVVNIVGHVPSQISCNVIFAMLMAEGKLQELVIPFLHMHKCHQEPKLLVQELLQDMFLWLTSLGWVGRTIRVPKLHQ